MKHRLAAAVVLGALTTGALATAGAATADAPPSTSAPTTAQCIYTPDLPAQLAINASTTNLNVGLDVSGTGDCAINFFAATTLSHGDDKYYLQWASSTEPSAQSVAATAFAPGTYTLSNSYCTAATTASGADETCTITPVTTEMKYASTSHLKVKRSKTAITFTASASHWSPSGSVAMADKIAIQREVGKNHWHTIHSAAATAKGMTWSLKATAKTKKATYRAVAASTTDAFAATSSSVTK